MTLDELLSKRLPGTSFTLIGCPEAKDYDVFKVVAYPITKIGGLAGFKGTFTSFEMVILHVPSSTIFTNFQDIGKKEVSIIS